MHIERNRKEKLIKNLLIEDDSQSQSPFHGFIEIRQLYVSKELKRHFLTSITNILVVNGAKLAQKTDKVIAAPPSYIANEIVPPLSTVKTSAVLVRILFRL